MKRALLALAATVALFFPTAVSAQEAESDPSCIHGVGGDFSAGACLSSDNLLGSLDLAVPENPLFTLMNSTPDTVIRPKVGDRLSISMLPQIADALGQEQYAFGIEINPGLFMMPERFTMAEFLGEPSAWDGSDQRERQLRDASMWSRFTISGAATRTTGDEATISRYGIGVNYNHDTGSPLWAHAQGVFGDCVRARMPVDLSAISSDTEDLAAHILAAQRLGVPNDQAHEAEILAEANAHHNELRAQIQELRDKILAESTEAQYIAYRQGLQLKVDECIAQAAPWNRRVYGAGVALYFSETEDDNVATPDSETGFGFWASYATPLGESDRRNQVIASLRYVDNGIRTRTEGGNEVTEVYDSWTVGARYVRSFAERDNSRRAFRGFVEAAYTQEEFGGVDDEFSQAGIGFEVQLRDNIFFQAMVGDTFGSDIERGSYLTGQIKWSFSEGPAR